MTQKIRLAILSLRYNTGTHEFGMNGHAIKMVLFQTIHMEMRKILLILPILKKLGLDFALYYQNLLKNMAIMANRVVQTKLVFVFMEQAST